MQPSLFLFSFFLMFSFAMVLSSSSWFMTWSGLEMNTISFISCIYEEGDKFSSENCFKYFFVQSISSIILLFFSQPIMNFLNNSLFINLALLFKLGAAPFHLWFISMMKFLKWIPCLLLSSIQKFIPLSMMFSTKSTIIQSFTIISAVMGSLGGLNQTNMKTLFAYSSVVHLSWLLSLIPSSNMIWIFYWACYFLLSLSIISIMSSMFLLSIKNMMNLMWPKQFLILFMFLSLGGLPPLFGFLPKWMALNNLIFTSPMISMILIITAILNLYFYIRAFYIPMLYSSPLSKFNLNILPISIYSAMFMTLTVLILPLIPISN